MCVLHPSCSTTWHNYADEENNLEPFGDDGGGGGGYEQNIWIVRTMTMRLER